jgi:SAM-dependent methyltransferase
VVTSAELYRAFDTSPEVVVDFLRWLVDAAGLPARPRVLDVGCGPGRLLLPLGALGWTVHGIEPDPDYLVAARAVAAQRPNLAARAGRFEALAVDQPYDLVMAVNGVFPYLLAPEQRRAALEAARAALNPGGLLLLDLANYPWIVEHYGAVEPKNRMIGPVRLRKTREHRVDRADRLFTTTDIIYSIGPGDRLDPLETRVHTQAILTESECLDALAAAGFTDAECYRGLEARRPEPSDGPRLVLVARRPPRRSGSPK